jgi:hypothetical protein
MKITTKAKKDKTERQKKRKVFTTYDIAVYKGKFLELLSKEVSYNETCKTLKLTTNTLVGWRKDDPIFGKAVDLYVSHKKPLNIATSSQRVRKELPTDVKKSTDIIDEVCEALENGTGFEMACLYASISCGAVRKMMIEDENIMKRLNKAEGTFVLTCTRRILEASKNDWKAAAFLLERRYPSLWGEVKQIEMTARSSFGKFSDTTIDEKHTIDIDVEPEKVIERIKNMSNKELMEAINKGKR